MRDRDQVAQLPAEEREALQCASIAPEIHPGTSWELGELSEQIEIPTDALKLASKLGYLGFTRWEGKECWSFRESKGRAFEVFDLARYRATDALWRDEGWTAWPIGAERIGRRQSVALVFGVHDFLAALALILAQGRVRQCAPVMMLKPSPRIPLPALRYLSHRRVRIFPHFDFPSDTGPQSNLGKAQSIACQLSAHGSRVTAFSFEGLRREDGWTVFNLHDVLSLPAEQRAADSELAQLMTF